jgi:hypothetical protein
MSLRGISGFMGLWRYCVGKMVLPRMVTASQRGNREEMGCVCFLVLDTQLLGTPFEIPSRQGVFKLREISNLVDVLIALRRCKRCCLYGMLPHRPSDENKSLHCSR